MLGLRMVTAKKSTKRHAVRSSSIMGGSRSANAASGSAGVLWTSCWVMGCPVFWRNSEKLQKDYHNCVMKGLATEVGHSVFRWQRTLPRRTCQYCSPCSTSRRTNSYKRLHGT